MDAFVTLALLVLALPVCAVAGFVMALGQRRQARMFAVQLAAFDHRLRGLERQFVAAPEPPPVPEVAPLTEPEPRQPDDVPRHEPAVAETPHTPRSAPAAEAGAAPGLEEMLGTRWAVWVGGVALALGGLFLVRYSIEQGLFGPSARVAAGSLFALALLAAGEWMRRREIASRVPGLASAHVPGVLTAAGTSTAFATVYAAYALYGLLPPAAAFILLGAVSVLTMAAAALHGPALAALGLVAALASPFLVATDEPNLFALVVYLAFVTLAAYGVARLRLWRWLALAAAGGAILWTVPLLLAGGPTDQLPPMLHVLLQTALAGLFLVADPYRRVPDEEAQPDLFANSVLLAFALLGILVPAFFEVGRPIFSGALAVVLLAFAVLYPAASPSAFWAAVVTTGALMLWPVAGEVAAEPYTVVPDAAGEAPRPEALQVYLAFAMGVPAAIAGASLWRVVRGGMPFRSAAWLCAAATLAPLSALVAAYWRVAHLERSVSFAVAAALLGLVFVAAAGWLRRNEHDDTVRLAVGATASAAVAALAAGLTFSLDKGMLTVAFALAALGTAWVTDRVAIPALRYAVGGIALVVLARILWDPAIVPGFAGQAPVFNWFLWGYGVPALAFYGASRILERGGRDRVVRLVESLAILFAALLAFFEIRHWIHDGDVFAATSGHLEMGLLATTGLAFAIVMVRMDASRPDVVYRIASLVFGAVSLLVSAIGLGLVHNPLVSGEPVPGGALVNSLLPAYLVPALVAAALAAFARRSRPHWYVLAAAGLALGLHLLYTIAAIRRAFQGPAIGLWQATSEAELWSYSVALLLIGLIILVVGFVWRIRLARMVSAAYIVAAVLKVFVIDLSHLEGITRALSFIGLGLALVGIGMAYQRLLVSGAAPRDG